MEIISFGNSNSWQLLQMAHSEKAGLLKDYARLNTLNHSFCIVTKILTDLLQLRYELVHMMHSELLSIYYVFAQWSIGFIPQIHKTKLSNDLLYNYCVFMCSRVERRKKLFTLGIKILGMVINQI